MTLTTTISAQGAALRAPSVPVGRLRGDVTPGVAFDAPVAVLGDGPFRGIPFVTLGEVLV